MTHSDCYRFAANCRRGLYRADAARSGKTTGHGLGLAIARIIVTSHGGKIRVTSQKGVGSTFRIILPN